MAKTEKKQRPLLSRPEKKRFQEWARDPKIGPEAAHRAMMYQMCVNRVLYKIDAIGTTSRRRRPQRDVMSADCEFRGKYDRNTMIATSRNLEMNFSFTRGLINIHVNNVVSSGPIIQVNTDDQEWNRRKEKYFNTWAKSRRCDARSVLWWGWMIRKCERRMIVDGDLLFVMTDTGGLQGIEGDRIANPPKKRNSTKRKFVHGVEVTPNLRPLAYHIWKRGNCTQQDDYLARVKWQDAIHAWDPDRFDQNRGMSALLCAVNDMRDQKETLEAVKGSMKLENMLGVVWETDLPNSATADPLGLFTTYKTNLADGTQTEKKEVAIEPGAWSVSLLPGEKVKTVQKQTPGNNFDPWMLLQARLGGLALDMPLEIALMYFTRGSFSSIKGAISQYHNAVQIKRTRLEMQVCNRAANWKVAEAMGRWRAGVRDSTALEPPKSEKTDPFDQSWQWPQLPLLEPNKEIEAEIKAYKLGVTTLTAIAMRRNEDLEKVARLRARELKMIIKTAEEEDVPPESLLPQVMLPGEKTGDNGDDDPDGNGKNSIDGDE